MATATGSISTVSLTNNGFIIGAKPISDMLNALATAGVLTKTSDTGQVNWASGPTASGLNQSYYEIFKLNDTRVTSAPLFMKFGYASPGTTTNMAVILTVQLGTGSDGVGNLTSASAVATYKGMNVTTTVADATARTVYASAGEGYLNIYGGCQTGAASPSFLFLNIERLRNFSTGALTGNGVSVMATFGACSAAVAAYTPSQNQITGTTVLGMGMIIGQCASEFASIANIFTPTNYYYPPVQWQGASMNQPPMYDGSNSYLIGFAPRGSQLYAPLASFLSYDFGTFTELGTTTLSVYGESHTFLCGTKYGAYHLPCLAPLAALNTTVSNTATYFMRQPLVRYD